MTEREEIMEILRQLSPHSPQWVRKIRAYIRHLERLQREADDERQRTIAAGAATSDPFRGMVFPRMARRGL